MLADSHIHIFENGYRNSGESEISSYEELIKDHSIKCALVVGYEGETWASGNNLYISSLAQTRSWMHPLGFLEVGNLQVANLESLLALGFEGISLYIFSESEVSELLAVDESTWAWLVDHKWMISVNSKSKFWDGWLEVMRSQPELTLLISHLGLPSVDPRPFQNRPGILIVIDDRRSPACFQDSRVNEILVKWDAKVSVFACDSTNSRVPLSVPPGEINDFAAEKHPAVVYRNDASMSPSFHVLQLSRDVI